MAPAAGPGGKKAFLIPRPYLEVPCGQQPAKKCVRGTGWLMGKRRRKEPPRIFSAANSSSFGE